MPSASEWKSSTSSADETSGTWQRRPETAARQERGMPKQKILVIEDDNDIRDLIKHNLAREGYEVTCTSEGEKGLKSLEKGAFDLVILDLMLPGMHGLEV